MNELITRSYPAEFRAHDDSGMIEGVPIVFDTPTDIGGWFQETIERGAISPDVLADVDLLVNHDMRGKRLARSIIPIEKHGGMDFEITEKDVRMRANLNRSRTDSNDLYLGIADGAFDGMSFAFRVKDERWEDVDTDYPKRFITKIDSIVEVSVVNRPAYTTTSIDVSRGDLASENDKCVLEKVREEKRAEAETLATENRELELIKIKAKLYN